MCNFGARSVWMNGRRVISSYLDVETIKDQYHILNPNPLDCIPGYILEDAVGDRGFKRMHHRRLNLIGGPISSCCSIFKSPERIDIIKQANKFSYVLGNI